MAGGESRNPDFESQKIPSVKISVPLPTSAFVPRFPAVKTAAWLFLVFATGMQAAQNAATSPAPVDSGEQAEIAVREDCECDLFQQGVKVFTDRSYVLKDVPESLLGKTIVRTLIGGINFRCTKPGAIILLTPDPSQPDADSLARMIEDRGFVRMDGQPFQLFGKDPRNNVLAYRKTLELGEELQLGKWAVLVGPSAVIPWQESAKKPGDGNGGELLYNGIRLPEEWPPRSIDPKSIEPVTVPWLVNPPKLIPIDVGRQLFVDDFLIGETDLKRTFHQAKKYEGNPVLAPQTEIELNRSRNAIACPKSGGVWWDPSRKVFRMWYEAGWLNTVCTATSHDGLHWERPDLDAFPGSNRVLDPTIMPDSWTVFPDYTDTDPAPRWKMFLRGPDGMALSRREGQLMVSPDGIHWSKPVECGVVGDRSTMFYNPFRKKWVFSIRWSVADPGPIRSRHYWERDDFLTGPKWDSPYVGADRKPNAPVFWARADRLDLPDPEGGLPPQLYNLDAVAYESLMLGVFEIYRRPGGGGLPKITELNLAYSRDGFHWCRPDRRAFIPASRQDAWDRGYVQSVGGVCVIQGDQLWFFYSGFQGNPSKADRHWTENGEYDRGSTGVAFLRRDGFASMDAEGKPGTLTTRAVSFHGSQLFVNIDAPQGELRAEILDESGKVIAPFTMERCESVSGDKTAQMIRWQGAEDFSSLAGKSVKFRFQVTNGKFYAFWVSPDKSGASNGYVAAGGPEYDSYKDSPKACGKSPP